MEVYQLLPIVSIRNRIQTGRISECSKYCIIYLLLLFQQLPVKREPSFVFSVTVVVAAALVVVIDLLLLLIVVAIAAVVVVVVVAAAVVVVNYHIIPISGGELAPFLQRLVAD